MAHKGRHVTLTGPVAITAGEQAQMRVTVSQRNTATVAEGDETFEAGPATAVAIARTSLHGQATDAPQWLVNITLVQD